MLMEREAPKRVATYRRVSTEEQVTGGFSLDAQEAKLRAYIALNEWTFYRDYVDPGVSGSTIADRPALQRLLADARARRFDVVLVYKLDRLSRNLGDLIAISKEFQALGIDLVSFNEKVDTTTSYGNFFFQVIGAVSELERNVTRERVITGKAQAAKKGRLYLQVPFGYRKIGKRKEARIEVDPETGPIARLVWEAYLELKSSGAVAEVLNELCGTKFAKSDVGRLLSNHFYAGYLRYDGHVHKGNHPAIITPEEFDAALQIRRLHTKSARAPLAVKRPWRKGAHKMKADNLRAYRWLRIDDSSDLELITNKERRERFVLFLAMLGRSARAIEADLGRAGFGVSHDTINRIIKRNSGMGTVVAGTGLPPTPAAERGFAPTG